MIKSLSKLYKKSKSDKVYSWEIFVEDNKYKTISGILNGSLIESEWTTCEGKNKGQSNETTPENQAVKEAEAKIKKKLESGYCEDLNNVSTAKYFEPMLAHKWEDYEYEVVYPLFTQPKLDGIRCIITKNGMFSRNGKPIVSSPHILDSLNNFFDLNPDIVLDGELYNHDLKDNFNKIVSLVKKIKPTQDDLKESKKIIEFHCYDMFNPENKDLIFKNRNEFLNSKLSENYNIKLVKTQLVKNESELNELYESILQDGYEGVIIRNLFGVYENKRSKNLLKRKNFIDSEFKILDIIEGVGNRSGTAGYMSFETTDGKKFKSNIKGTFEYLADLFKNKETYIGKIATIKYFNLTPDGIPRFPYVTSIRDYE